jgi:signal peptidase I
MGHVGDADDLRVARELVEETLEECERLLEAAHAAAAEIRSVAQRHALERGDAAVRALAVAAERLRQDAASDRAAAREARELAERERAAVTRARAEIDAELHAATAALDVARHEAQRLRDEAEAHLRDAAATRAALLAEAHETAAALQSELLEELDDEVTARLEQLDRELSAREEAVAREEDARRRAADEAAVEVVADAERAADEAVRRADRIASERLAEAERTSSELIEDAEQRAAARLAAAEQRVDALARAAAEQGEAERVAREAEEAAASDRLASMERDAAAQHDRAHAEANGPLLTAYQEARRIIAEAEAEAAAIRGAAQPTIDLREPEPDEEESDPPGSHPPGERRRRPRWVRNLRLLALVLVALAGTELLRTHVAEPYTVAKTSMEPRIHDGDRLFVNKLAYRTGEPSRGDVVVFDTTDVPGSGDAPGTTLVKRVIGLPGEVVQALDGDIVIDGAVIDDPWSDGDPTAAFGPVRVPEEMLFVLGDNRGLSVDSRTFGAVPIDSVIGRVEAIIWPPSDAGRV